jgi:hypothetical protein
VEITPVESAGYQLLNGIQALAYCRIRYTAGSDYKRTERQRAVLTQIFDSARKQGVPKLIQIADSLLNDISTSFSNTELIGLATTAAGCSLGETTGFPFELQAANIAAGDCVVPVNLANNVSELHAFLYGTEGYTPSSTVQQISDEIISKLHHSCTLIPAKGMYSGRETNMLVCVVNKSQVAALTQIIKKYPNTFAVMDPVSEVMGNFKRLDSQGHQQVELLDQGDIV